MGDVWQSTPDKEHLKSRVTSHLQNMFIQKYDECEQCGQILNHEHLYK